MPEKRGNGSTTDAMAAGLRTIARQHYLGEMSPDTAKQRIRTLANPAFPVDSLSFAFRRLLGQTFPGLDSRAFAEPFYFGSVTPDCRQASVVQTGDALLRHVPGRTLVPTRTSYRLGRCAAPLLNGSLHEERRPKVFEFGLGSGIVAASILRSCGDNAIQYVGGELDSFSVGAARESARWNGFGKEDLSIRAGNGFSVLPLGSRVDLIVSNPPYWVSSGAKSPKARGLGPVLALDGGKDGTVFYSRILMEGGRYIKEGGHFLLQVPPPLLERVTEMAKSEYPASLVSSTVLEPHREGSDLALVVQAA